MPGKTYGSIALSFLFAGGLIVMLVGNILIGTPALLFGGAISILAAVLIYVVDNRQSK